MYYSYEQYEERLESDRQDSLSQGEWMSEALNQYAAMHGTPDRQWVLSPFDTWERNPCYRGPEQTHPEDREYMSEEEADAEEAALKAYRAQLAQDEAFLDASFLAAERCGHLN